MGELRLSSVQTPTAAYVMQPKEPTAAPAFQPLPRLNQITAPGFTQGLPTGPQVVAGGVDMGSGYPVGLIQAIQIQVNQLSAISANVGNLIINTGGSISSGETAYGVGTGFWLGTTSAGVPQFSIQDQNGNFLNVSVDGSGVLAINSEGISGALTSLQIDNAGLGNTASWNSIAGTPTTLSSYGITDGQSKISNASGVGYVLYRDLGGTIYTGPKYGSEIGMGGQNIGGGTFTTNVLTQLGGALRFPNPGTPTGGVNINGAFTCTITASAGTPRFVAQLEYSTDGGSTFTQFGNNPLLFTSTTSEQYAIEGTAVGLTFTGDLIVRVRAENFDGVNTITVGGNNQLTVQIIPNAGWTYISGSLAVSVPGSASGNCTSVYPSTTCAATCNVSVSVGGGTTPYTAYSWAVTSGTGTITSGSTSVTCTVSDTETATTGGATHNTVVACTVTDSTSQTPTAGSASANVATLTFASNIIPVGAVINVSGCTPAAYNKSNATVTFSSATQIKYSIASTPGAMTGFGTVNDQRVTSGGCTVTNTFTLTYSPITANVTTSPGACSTSTCGSNCTASGTATANASGGNGSYTYSWSVLSGTGTITSGSTSQTCTVQDTEATTTAPGTSYATNLQCSVNDSRGTGAVTPSGTLRLRFSCPAV